MVAPAVTNSVRVMLAVMLMVEAVVLSSAFFSSAAVVTLTVGGSPDSPSCAHVPTDVSIMMLRSSKPRRRLAALVLLVKNLFMLYLY